MWASRLERKLGEQALWVVIMEQVRLRYFLELVRFSHTIFAMPFALLSAVMAWWLNSRQGLVLGWKPWAGVVLCMVFARTAAMAFNRLADQKVDSKNPRTTNRHLPQGLLSRRAVWFFFCLNAMGFVASSCLFYPNPWPARLSIPVLLFLCSYSYSKRFTVLAHFWLGTSLMLAPVAAWIALRGQPGSLHLEWAPILLGAVVLFWVAGFDIIYACQDEVFDRKHRLRSIPAWLGARRALQVACFCHVIMVLSLVILAAVFPWGKFFYTGIVCIAALLVYEHSLVRPGELDRVNLAFFHVNSIISMGLLLIGAADLLLR